MLNRNEIMKLHIGVDANDAKMSFVSTFNDAKDLEIAIVITCWLSNGARHEDYIAQKLISCTMKGKPYSFIMEYPTHDDFCQMNDICFCGAITYKNLHEFLIALHDAYSQDGGLERICRGEEKKRKAKYAYENLCDFFVGYDSGIATRHSNGTHYRLNLLLYMLTHKFNLWKTIDKQSLLLPCNDKILKEAKRLDLMKTHKESCLNSVITLTKKARDAFGDDGFYKLYEILNSSR